MYSNNFLPKCSLPLILSLLLLANLQAQNEPVPPKKSIGFCGSEMNATDWEAYRNIAKKHREYLATAGEQRSAPLLRAPVVFHILHNSQGEGVTIEQVGQALAWANEKFAPADIQFFQCLPPNIIVSDSWFNQLFLNNEPTVCGSPRLDYQLDELFHVSDAINIYCVNTSGSSWSRGPSQLANCFDWVVFHQGHVGSQWILGHELGHYFGIPHTFNGLDENVTRNPNNSCFNCEEEGDLFCDTPADHHDNGTLGWNSGCVPDLAQDDCGVVLQPDGLNIMSYSNSACPAEDKYFSPEQRSRMYFVFEEERDYLDCNSDCENGLNLSGEHLSNWTYRSNTFIESSAEVYPNDYFVIYQAETYIDLNVGFNATANSIFIAQLVNCTDDGFSDLPPPENKSFARLNGKLDATRFECSVLPNPFAQEFQANFHLPQPTLVSLRLLDALGSPAQIVLAGEAMEAGEHSLKINTETLPDGFYFLEITAGQNRQIQKVVKFHR